MTKGIIFDMGGVLIDLFYDRCVAAYLRSLKQLSDIDKDFLDY